MRRTKYRAKPQVTEDGRFDSIKEMNRWNELKLLHQAGEIFRLSRDKNDCTFHLEVNKQLVCKYVADAVYYEPGSLQIVVEDTKSEMTRKLPVYRLKKKLMLACHGISIREA